MLHKKSSQSLASLNSTPVYEARLPGLHCFLYFRAGTAWCTVVLHEDGSLKNYHALLTYILHSVPLVSYTLHNLYYLYILCQQPWWSSESCITDCIRKYHSYQPLIQSIAMHITIDCIFLHVRRYLWHNYVNNFN